MTRTLKSGVLAGARLKPERPRPTKSEGVQPVLFRVLASFLCSLLFSSSLRMHPLVSMSGDSDVHYPRANIESFSVVSE